MAGRILGMGGFTLGTGFDDLVLELARGPRMLFVPTPATGGNTANALAVWRVHGFDALVREAWEGGALLCGFSAGMICWFEASVTDSFGPQLAGMRDGLGLLPGSACPHYDGDELRRPVYTGLVRDGFPPGVACDDAAAVLYDGTALVDVVAGEHDARAYRVTAAGEEPLEVTRRL